MSEYMEQHSVSRLIGAPPGYIGFDEGGQLTEAVRRKPYSVVLFDEVEKAHPQVLNVLLQVLDDGRLTDGQGRTVDFSNTVIIMTSNLGAHHMLVGVTTTGELTQEAIDNVMGEVRKHFRPEFLNRLDDIVLFTPLSKRELRQIVHLQLETLTKRLEDKHITLDITEDAIQLILDEAYSPTFGARPLRRYVERVIGTQLSKMLINGELVPNSVVQIDAKEGKLVYNVSKTPSGGSA